jgi:flagellar protein FlgJ
MHGVKSATWGLNGHEAQRRREARTLRGACQDFESLVMHELLKGMRRTVEKCDLFHGGSGEEIYESLLDMELAKKMAGLGPKSLAEMLYRQLSPERADAGHQNSPSDSGQTGIRSDRASLQSAHQGADTGYGDDDA